MMMMMMVMLSAKSADTQYSFTIVYLMNLNKFSKLVNHLTYCRFQFIYHFVDFTLVNICILILAVLKHLLELPVQRTFGD
jgi:hypothetical protein